jgi:hypothetical protein
MGPSEKTRTLAPSTVPLPPSLAPGAGRSMFWSQAKLPVASRATVS